MAGLVLQSIAGGVGGSVVGTTVKRYDLGIIGNLLVGILGGGIGAQIIGALVGDGVVNELMTLYRQQTMNRLKSYITDPYLRINRKGVQTYDYENRAHFMLFSNYEDAAKIENGDRRYFVWISKAKKREDSYYADLMRWFKEEGGAEAVLHFLQQRDISGFNPDAPAPLTESKKQVIELSRSATEAYLQEPFNAADAPFQCDLVAINDAIDCLRKEKNMTVSHTVLSKFMRNVGAVSLGAR